MHKLNKRETKAMIEKVIIIGVAAKNALSDTLGPDTIDFMVEATLEKLGVEPRKQDKMYTKG